MRKAAQLCVLALMLMGCGGKGGSEDSSSTAAAPPSATQSQPSAAGCTSVKAPAPKPDGTEKRPSKLLDRAKTYTVTFETNCGSFTITLDQKQSPHAAAAFAALAKSGFFDNTIFHRIVPGFVIQGGDPTATGTGGSGYLTIDTPPPSAKYVRGVVAMAKTAEEDPGTAGSQFFVVTGADIGLPPEYAIIGKVTKGMPVVLRIGKLGSVSEQPTQAVVVEHAAVSES